MTCELNIHTTTPQRRSTRSIAAKALAATVAVVLGVAMTACSSDATDVAATTTVALPGQTTTTIASTLPPYQSPLGDIVGEALTAGAFTTLAGLLVDAGLVQALRAPGPFTVFAPTDKAFAKIPKEKLEALLMDKKALTAELAGRGGRVIVFARTQLGSDRIAGELRERGVPEGTWDRVGSGFVVER